MADETELTRKRRSRGRYREYMRHSNLYIFPAARRRKGNLQKVRKFNKCESDVQEVFCEQPRVTSSHHELLQADTINSPHGVVCSDHQMPDMDDSSDFEFKDKDDPRLIMSKDEQVDMLDIYEQFVKDDDAGSYFFSDCENIQSDSETVPEQREIESSDVLYSGAPITSSSSVVLLLSFVFKHKLTREAFTDLLSVIGAHCPRPNNCKTTIKKLFEFVSHAKGDIVKHYFCGYCKAYYGKDVNGNCDICGENIQKTGGFFIEVPIANQLQTFFTDAEFVDGLKYQFQRVKRADINIQDVFDGTLYKSKCGPGRFLSKPYNLSVKLNTDRVAIFRSSQFGVWPLFFLVNELPPSLRRKSKYRVFGGLWFGEDKPFFSTFFKPFVETLQQTELHGK